MEEQNKSAFVNESIEKIKNVIDGMIIAEPDGTTHKSIITNVSEDNGGETNSCVMTNGSIDTIKHAFTALFQEGDKVSEIARTAFLNAAISGMVKGINIDAIVMGSKEKNDNKENN